MVTPLKSHLQAVPRTPPEGVGQVTVMAKKKVKSDHFLFFYFFAQFFWWNDVLGIILRCSHTRDATLDWHIRIGDLGYENYPTLNSGKYFWKRVLFCESKLKLRRFSSGKSILDSGNKYTTHNQQFHWDVLRRWWLNLSLSLSLFIPIFRVQPVSLRDCLYCEKDVDGGLCRGHISHLVHPKTCFLDRLQHAKKDRKISQTPFRRDSDSQKKSAGWRRQTFFVGDKLRWHFRLDKLVNLTSWLDKLTCHLALLPLFKSLDKF